MRQRLRSRTGRSQFKKGFVRISTEAEEELLSYSWPGNIRELRNAVERIVLLEKGEAVLGRHLSFLGGREGQQENAGSFKPVIPSQGVVLDEVEKDYILESLRMKKGNKNQAARLLGISRSALLYRMEKHGIKEPLVWTVS